jgi:glycerol-3-phosphate acyltransferase PlsX
MSWSATVSSAMSALKASEGFAKLIADQLRSEFKKNTFTQPSRAAFPDGVARVQSASWIRAAINGASLLGLNGVIIKSHGSADVYAFEQAILKAAEEVRGGLLRRIAEQVGVHNDNPNGVLEEGELA